jgi:Rps23 Pro-64 3,4-dihydroxylase Tpa1-like proline 4-hydroxylase
LKDTLDKYILTYYNDLGELFKLFNINEDSGFQIQRYTKDVGLYNFHNDFHIDGRGFRSLTYLFYLNDVEEGGETEFYNGLKIKAERGKLIFFPSSWNYVHKGNMPLSSNKYIITGWVYSKIS